MVGLNSYIFSDSLSVSNINIPRIKYVRSALSSDDNGACIEYHQSRTKYQRGE